MKGEILTLNREDSQIPFSHVIKVNITNNKTYCPNLFQYMMYREEKGMTEDELVGWHH